MIEEDEKHERVHGFRLFGMVLPSLTPLMFKLGGVYLKFKRDAKKGGHVFQKELIKQGLDTTTAAELTEIYLEGSNLNQYLQLFR